MSRVVKCVLCGWVSEGGEGGIGGPLRWLDSSSIELLTLWRTGLILKVNTKPIQSLTASTLPLRESFPICLYWSIDSVNQRHESGKEFRCATTTVCCLHLGVRTTATLKKTSPPSQLINEGFVFSLVVYSLQFDDRPYCDGSGFFSASASQVGSTTCKVNFLLRAVQNSA